METVDALPEQMQALLETLAQEGLESAAHGLSVFVGHEIRLTEPRVAILPITEVPSIMGGPETLAVGIYLAVDGDMDGHILLLLEQQAAAALVDLLMDNAPGTTTALGPLERSALAEVGNLTGALFLNSVARMCGVSARPSPPAVLEDMVGAILDVIVVAVGAISEYIVAIETTFCRSDRRVEALFWVIPNLDALGKSLG
ncbi:MAG TPA: CheY-P-specific phosphatase CheC [Chloroflexi bacterium]|jgi:chemotaxis protein CheC|nr:CheY-P-specific phosphatase CheC [Chloroflexota bacterium]